MIASSQKRTWYPPLSPNGAEAVNDTHRYLLCSGPKKCGKTFSLGHKVAKHLYDHDGARVAIVVRRKGSAALGVWTHLTDDIIEQQWQKRGRVLPWIKRPSTNSATKQPFFIVKNAHGGSSYCYLFSLFNPKDVEEVFKNTAFSMIYVNEMDQFDSPAVFRAMSDQLRSTSVKDEFRQLVADCNPPQEGSSHWMHGLFIDPPEGTSEEYRKQFRVMYFTPDDNPFISDREKMEIREGYKSDPDKYARYWEGKWIASTTGTLFENLFDQHVHVIGRADPMEPEEHWRILVPPVGTTDLFTSWDLGMTSHSLSFICKRWAGERLVFDVIDEIVSIDLEVPLSEFVKMALAKMDRWEKYLSQSLIGQKYPRIDWRHWSDTSSFRYNAAAESTEAALVRKYSDGRIYFNRIKKPPIDFRIEMVRGLLQGQQLYFSVLAPHHISAMKLLRKEGLMTRQKRESANQRKHTHPFDSMTYGISHEMPMTLQNHSRPAVARLFSVPTR